MLRNSKEKSLRILIARVVVVVRQAGAACPGGCSSPRCAASSPLAVLHHRRHQHRHSTLMPLHRAIVSPCRRARSRRLYLVPVASVSPVQPAPGCSTPTFRNRKE